MNVSQSFLAVCAMVLVAGGATMAADPAMGKGKAPPSASSSTARIGEVTVFAKDKRVEVPGEVCLRKGILEFLAVLPESGKEYESLLILKCKAASLHAALLAIGARPGRVPEEFLGDRLTQPDKSKRRRRVGDRLAIRARWKDGARAKSAPMGQWLLDRATGKPSARLEWVFSGSFFGKLPQSDRRVYAADQEKLAVALWHNEVCVLNLAKAAGSPYRGKRLGYEANTRALPALGTAVLVGFHLKK